MKFSSASRAFPRMDLTAVNPAFHSFIQSHVPFFKIKEQLGSVIRLLCNYLFSTVLGFLEG